MYICDDGVTIARLIRDFNNVYDDVCNLTSAALALILFPGCYIINVDLYLIQAGNITEIDMNC